MSAPNIGNSFVPTTADGASASFSLDGSCLFCTVGRVQNVVNPKLFAASRVTIPAGVPARARVRVDLAAAMPAGRSAGFVIRDRTGLLDLSVFENITVRTLLDGVVQDEERNGSALRVSVAGGERRAVLLTTSATFDALEIEFGGAALLLTQFDVYYAAVQAGPPPAVMLHREATGATLTTEVSPLCIACSFNTGSALVDAVYGTAARMTVPMGVLGGASVRVDFGQTVPAGTRTGILVRPRTGLLTAEVMQQISIEALFGDASASAVSGDQIRRTDYADGRSVLWVRSEQATDAVLFAVTGAVLLGMDIDLGAVVSVLPNEVGLVIGEEEAVQKAMASVPADDGAWTVASRTLEASGAPSPRATLSPPSPNPATSATTLRLTGAVGESVAVSVYDALGRQMARVHDGPLTGPATSLRIDTDGWAPGVYVVRAIGRNGQDTERLTVAR